MRQEKSQEPNNSPSNNTPPKKEIQRLKRDLVLQVYTKSGDFWEAIHDLRTRWDIVPLIQLAPPTNITVHYPEEQSLITDIGDLRDFNQRWCDDIAGLKARAVPLSYRNDRGGEWDRFLSACVLYDPPETDLLAFAAYADPAPWAIFTSRWELVQAGLDDSDLDGLPTEVAPPVEMLSNPYVAARIEWQYWERLVHELGERYLKPLGLDVWNLVGSILKSEDGEWEAQREYFESRKQNKRRPYIVVDEYTTEEDVRRAYQMIRASYQGRPREGRPKRDCLTAVECAVLHDNHGWTYDQLADRYGWHDPNLASKYIRDGRGILATSSQNSEGFSLLDF